MGKYDNIIDRKYEGTTSRRPMSLENRAAQFAPFAALTGHDEAISETARQTSERIELSEEEQRELSGRMKILLEHLVRGPVDVTVTLFRPDPSKPGGRYVPLTSTVRRYDEFSRTLLTTSGQTIPLVDILALTILV
ncbi:MAG: hypothetical protein NC336_09070 [Clostridium sp.]|nr:hypothetical protein [Clostridium sp.]